MAGLLEDRLILVSVLAIGIVIGLAIGVPAGQFSESTKCHPETNPNNASGVLVKQFQSGSYYYFDLYDNGEIKTVYTSDPVLAHHVVNGTFYKFSLATTVSKLEGTAGFIDQQVIP